jgi:hypothetical protein
MGQVDVEECRVRRARRIAGANRNLPDQWLCAAGWCDRRNIQSVDQELLGTEPWHAEATGLARDRKRNRTAAWRLPCPGQLGSGATSACLDERIELPGYVSF